MTRMRLYLLALAVAVIYSAAGLGLLDVTRMTRGLGNIGVFVADMFPPDASVVAAVSGAMIETIQIALVGTVIGTVLALPLALLAMPTLTNRGVAPVLRFILAFVRTVPALLWGVLFVVAFGLGPTAGAVAIGLYSTGYLGKLFYELLEGVDPEVVEAVRSVGCSRLQLARYALMPEAANGLLAQLLFMFEYNVRSSAIMGFVGAGGIGYFMLQYIQLLRYDALFSALLVTLAVVLVLDVVSSRVRAAFSLRPAGEG